MSQSRSSLSWLSDLRGPRSALSWLIVLAMAYPATVWILNSPMNRYSDKFWGHSYFPREGPEDRFQYDDPLDIKEGERVRDATCVLCSLTISGSVEHAAPFWGDVTIKPGGHAREVIAEGGSITLEEGAGIGDGPVYAAGGTVKMAPAVNARNSSMLIGPSLFFPGERSFPTKGVMYFAFSVLVTVIFGGLLLPGTFRRHMETTAGQLLRNALLGIFLGAVPWTLLFFAAFFLYAWPPIAFVLYVLAPTIYSFVLALGLAAIAEFLGSRFGFESGLRGRILGAMVLLLLMLLPVAGLFIMLALLLSSAGAGTRILFGNQMDRLSGGGTHV